MTTVQIKSKVKAYKVDIIKLEKLVKKWEEDFRIKKVSQLSKDCYGAFTDLQMTITKIKDLIKKQQIDLDCYEETYKFLTFVENDLDTDFCVLLVNKSKEFSNLIKQYSKYCTKTESKYAIEEPGHITSAKKLKAPSTTKTTRKK